MWPFVLAEPCVIHRLPIPAWHAMPRGPSDVGSATVLTTANDGTS
jgi:hypothetical protein